jgi:glutaredoxin
MADSKKESKSKTVTSRVSVHVIFYSCPECGHEVEHVQFCDKCDKEMRVIDVVEKFGSEAQEIIEKAKALRAKKSNSDDEEESPNIIIISEEDEEAVEEDDEETITEEEVMELDDIFADNDESPSSNDDPVDITDLTNKLDESDEENTFEEIDIDPDDLPEL